MTRIKTKRTEGNYEHFCILILGQEGWKDKDRENVKEISLSERKKVTHYDYHFYHKLTYH